MGMKFLRLSPFVFGVLLLSACEIEPVAVPPVEVPAGQAVTEFASTATVPVVSGAAQPASTSYGPVSQYLGASDARPDGRGLTDTRTLTPAQCGRGCVPTPGQRTLDASRDRLVADTVRNVRNGGTSVISVTGSVDNQQKRITAPDSRQLAANRARDTAQTVANEIRADLKEANVSNVVVKPVAAGSAASKACGTGGLVCVLYQAHPQVIAECKSPANGGCQLDLGRLARATAVHSSGARTPFGGGGGNDSSGTSVEVDGVAGAAGTSSPSGVSIIPGGANPGAGVFGSFPPGGSSAGAGGTSGGSSSTTGPGADAGTGGSSGTVDDPYFGFYPEDRFDLDEVSVRIVLDVPRTFRVGGTLTERRISVKEVVVYCGASPCTSSGAPTVTSLSGTLSVASSDAGYRLCASERSLNCAYYLGAGSVPSVGISGSSLSGGRVDVGFRSPTASGVRVYPTLAVEEVSLRVYDPSWIGGGGCDASVPPKSCWEWVGAFDRDVTASVTVVSTAGEILAKGPAGYRLAREVYGTVGSR